MNVPQRTVPDNSGGHFGSVVSIGREFTRRDVFMGHATPRGFKRRRREGTVARGEGRAVSAVDGYDGW